MTRTAAVSADIAGRPPSAHVRVRGRPLRLFYASGPGDNIKTYHHWREGQDDPFEPVVPYSGQFYELCRETGAEAFVISTCSRRDSVRDGRLRIEHRPFRGRLARGPLFHAAQFWYGLRLLASILRFRPDVAIINEGAQWFMLAPLAWAGIRVVPSLHVRLDWRGRTSRIWLAIHRLNRRFFRRRCAAVLVASEQIAEDVRNLAGADAAPLIEFLPLYRRSTFAAIRPADPHDRPFNILFAGRIEPNKGVFDLLDAAKLVWARVPDVHFHACGTGSALEELERRVAAAGASERFHVHGYCDRARLSEMYAMVHAVVVPTRSEFGEGFNQVTAEGVLTGRPVVTSRVCPALAYVREAVVEVPPDDPPAYADAVIRLASDDGFYRRKREGCRTAQEQFYDAERSWGAVVRRLIDSGV